MDEYQRLNKTTEPHPSEKKKARCCDHLKMFLAALSFSYICKTIGGVNMKTAITQIERRFDISSSVAGFIDGGFEIGNLLVIVFVSYFGSKLHRPKIIGIGCVIMGAGSILTALPHFFMGYYRYSIETHVNTTENSISTCSINQTVSLTMPSPEIVEKGCEKQSESYMWIYVLMGNMLRGIGETPIGPLGISYLDDFAKEGQSSVYLGILNSLAMIGVVVAFLMGSVFTQMYVDVGYVDLSSVRITPRDSRWVGAWWLGFLMCGLLSIICSIPFFFLPKSLNEPQNERKVSTFSHGLKTDEEKNQTANLTDHEKPVTLSMSVVPGTTVYPCDRIWPRFSQNLLDSENMETTVINSLNNRGQVKCNNFQVETWDMQELRTYIPGDFLQSMKSLLTNHLYILFVVSTVIYLSSVIGGFTYVFKYIEQQYGQSISQGNFLLGLITIPCMTIGMVLGGYLIKKLKLTLVGIAKFSCFTAFMGLICQLLYFALLCDRKSIAGLTLAYDGINPLASHANEPLSYCNSDCNCDENEWEPICGKNGMTYLSPCLAGCTLGDGNKKPTVFYNCSCLEVSGFKSMNYSAHLGECPRDSNCRKRHYFYVAVQVMDAFFSALGATSFILLLVKNVLPELKSLAMGFHSLVIRALGGILAPIYFGAMIDRTCIKWSTTSCGARGACRVYDSVSFGIAYLGLNSILRFLAFVLYVALVYAMKKKYEGKDTKALENGRKIFDETSVESLNSNGHFVSSSSGVNDTHM